MNGEYFVADLVTPLVVDQHEAVEVDEQQTTNDQPYRWSPSIRSAAGTPGRGGSRPGSGGKEGQLIGLGDTSGPSSPHDRR
jgi:hypothetical protein